MWPMAIEQGPISVLDDSEAWNLLSSVALGRLVTSFGGQLEIFPVNFITENGTVLFRTAEGTKLFTTVMNEKVLFEADDHTADEGWSVILRGTARMLSGVGSCLIRPSLAMNTSEPSRMEALIMFQMIKPMVT